ncbi:GEVED domain-containing protein [Bizionia myxarmorum]|uniref:Choice-of-anchor D domain-containing protein n=1 Tax=Bizionia myxarmorum TaxID=291186 RepID=A0A5D0RBI9_9FLAO|nr:GEVED domain-containing protein [Bizionia myxarmorum]TYB78872.1 choice-of-anchor D domain-containing protein [Bizionia myxarmorum]
MKQNYILICLGLLCSLMGFGQANENFTNVPTSSSGSYQSRTWTGTDAVTWNATFARTDQTLTNKAVCTNGSGTVTSPIYTGGMGTLTFNYVRAFTGGDARSLTVWVNGTQIGGTTTVSSTLNTTQNYSATINVGGSVSLEIRTAGAQIKIDDISWTAYSACAPPANPVGTITGTTPACASTTLTYTGTTIPGTIDYWQTTATGTSTANNATGTFNATATGTYYVRTFLTATSCWANGTASYAVVINSAPTISSQPTNASRVIPATATFSVTASGTPNPTYQWQVSTNGGGTWANVSGGTGATSNSYTTGATSAPMNNNQYRCVVTNTCGSINSNAGILSLSNSSPNNALQLKACIANTQSSLSWNASSTAGVTGYIVFAQPNTTIPQMAAASAGNASAYIANADYSAATTYTTLGKAIYKGAGTTATVIGLTNASQYTFKVVAYTGETGTGWASAINNTNTTSTYTQTYTIDVPEVSNLAASIDPTTSTVQWNVVPDSAGCYEYMVVANAGPVTLTPTGNGSTYTANSVLTGANQVVYKGTGSSIIVTGLTDAVEYCYTVFVREVNSGTQWSDGISVCQTTGTDYCAASGGTNNSRINNVTFNTINQSSTSTAGYTDYTGVTTNVNIGEVHNLSVTVDSNGNYTSYIIAWIDWNRDGDFSDSGEAYELGTVTNNANGTSSASPFSITVPTGAAIGNVIMRVSANSENSIIGYSTPCQSFTYGEVEDYTIIITQPANAEINVKGGTISIANGFDAPYGLNNTLFATTPLNTDSAEKEFTIENIGIANLLLTGSPIIKLEGANPTDFIVTQQATTPVVNGTNATFRIKFRPTVAGLRTANVRIESNDSDENPYIFAIEGNGNCTISPVVTTFPTSGPANTLVTFTSSTSNLTGATITFNNIAVPTVSNTSDTIEVLIPANANDGNFIIQLATGCSATQFFDVIDTDLTACETAVGGGNATGLIIYELYDENGGSGGVITIYNNTGASVNLSTYSIQRAGDYGVNYSTYANLSGTLALNAVAIISVSSSSCGYTSTGNGSFGATGFNANDGFRLMNGSTLIDDVQAPNYVGYYLKRRNTNFYPNTTFTASEWTAQSLAKDECLAGVGSVPLVKVPPTVSVLNPPIFACTTTIQLSVTGAEGVPSGFGLTYQWYYLAPNATTFVVVPSTADFNNNSTSATLDINNPIAYLDYQFYCQVRENTATCYTTSNAVKLDVIAAVWDGTAWSSPPTSSKIAYINADYNTSINVNGETSFEACQLIVTSGSLLTISEDHYVDVINNVIVNGDGTSDGILIEDKGSFVQRGNGINAGTYTHNINAKTQVNKRTAFLNNWYEYTYWSSPVANETIGNGLAEAHPTRRYWYNGQNYLDAFAEINNNNGAFAGQDDVDDNGNDWQNTNNSDIMIPGVGYAAMHNPVGFITPGIKYQYEFNGSLNTGDYTVPIYRNDAEMDDNNWNFIGNPYASAIDADEFFDKNVYDFLNQAGTLDGAIFLWSQSTPPSNTSNGNENLNFAQSDYAIINGTGETAGGDNNNDGTVDISDKPKRFIPSGQGFFVSLSDDAVTTTVSGTTKLANVIFQNSMRVTGDNDQFFRPDGRNPFNKLWINMWSDNGVRNQILVGYVDGATNELDGMYYDAPKNLSTGENAMIYTVADNSDKKLAIQGKSTNSLNEDEVISLGFYSIISEATLYSISISSEGSFFEENTVFLKDYLMNISHNLSASNYTFTSNVGVFNNRFEIVFKDNALSINENALNNNSLTIIELQNDDVKFSIGSGNTTIKSVEIIDLLGRTLYKFKGNSHTETFNLSNLSTATYMAKVTLSNNQVLIKKAVKK